MDGASVTLDLIEANEKDQFIEIWLGHLKVSRFFFTPMDVSPFNEVFHEVIVLISSLYNFLCIRCG